eukprot:6226917-Amphidinium_carterae.1
MVLRASGKACVYTSWNGKRRLDNSHPKGATKSAAKLPKILLAMPLYLKRPLQSIQQVFFEPLVQTRHTTTYSCLGSHKDDLSHRDTRIVDLGSFKELGV